MENWKNFVKIDGKENSPIEIGNSIVIDGHVDGKKNAVFTHFHLDHIQDFDLVTGSSYHKILLHHITYEVMIALKNPRKFMKNIISLPYASQSHTTKFGERITLFDADHIPGSCQVLVEIDNTRILYSGDFVFPSAATPKCDILVLDANHGIPQFTTNTDIDSEMNSLLFEIKVKMQKVIKERIVDDQQPVAVSAPRGTLQSIMNFLDVGNDFQHFSDDVPFIAKKNEITILKTLFPNTNSTREFIDIETPEGYRKKKNKSPAIFFTSALPTGELSNMYSVITDRYANFKNEPAISEHKAKDPKKKKSHANKSSSRFECKCGYHTCQKFYETEKERKLHLAGVSAQKTIDLQSMKKHLKKCPKCGRQARTEKEIQVDFGYRVINGVKHQQSWCRECRTDKPNKIIKSEKDSAIRIECEKVIKYSRKIINQSLLREYSADFLECFETTKSIHKSIQKVIKKHPYDNESKIRRHIPVTRRLPKKLLQKLMARISSPTSSAHIAYYATDYYKWDGDVRNEEKIVKLAMKLAKGFEENNDLRLKLMGKKIR